ncbi:MAG: HAD family hydrolase [Firmicutes bacterium]|nr:HAD family hydrolase [Bacillota bacterium]
MIRALLFDFDGTLADTLPLIYRCFREMWVEIDGRERSDQEIMDHFGPPEEEIIRREVPAEQLEYTLHRFYTLYAELHPEEVRLETAIHRLLRHLKTHGYQVGVVTGKGRRSAEISLSHLGMEEMVDTLVTGSEVNRYKPHPEGIKTALEHLGHSPEEAVFIGDSSADVRAGKAGGLATIGVRWFPGADPRPFDPMPDQVVASPEELMSWLERKTGG